jgi:hypothetical protein
MHDPVCALVTQRATGGPRLGNRDERVTAGFSCRTRHRARIHSASNPVRLVTAAAASPSQLSTSSEPRFTRRAAQVRGVER